MKRKRNTSHWTGEVSARKRMKVSFADCPRLKKIKEETWRVVITCSEHSHSTKRKFQALNLSSVHSEEHLEYLPRALWLRCLCRYWGTWSLPQTLLQGTSPKKALRKKAPSLCSLIKMCERAKYLSPLLQHLESLGMWIQIRRRNWTWSLSKRLKRLRSRRRVRPKKAVKKKKIAKAMKA